MAEAKGDTVIDVLQRHLTEVTRRKGPHSTIAKTLTAALRSGNDRDLSAGLFAYAHFDKYYEQLTLEVSRQRVRLARPPTEVLRSPPATKEDIERATAEAEQERKERKEKEERETLEKQKANSRKAFEESRLPDGLDFSRHDPRSASRKRHLLAKAPRSERRVALKKKKRR